MPTNATTVASTRSAVTGIPSMRRIQPVTSLPHATTLTIAHGNNSMHPYEYSEFIFLQI